LTRPSSIGGGGTPEKSQFTEIQCVFGFFLLIILDEMYSQHMVIKTLFSFKGTGTNMTANISHKIAMNLSDMSVNVSPQEKSMTLQTLGLVVLHFGPAPWKASGSSTTCC
jgi:hypothetical protein